MSGPTLSEVAAWDLSVCHGSVAVLDELAGRLPAWRFRLEDVGWALQTAECWSGPAATVAADAVVEVTTVAASVTRALQRSLAEFERLTAEVASVQRQLTEARAIAAAAGVHLDDEGRPDPPVPVPGAMTTPEEAGRLAVRARMAENAAELASEARRRGALAVAAAETAGEALGAIGVLDAFAPLTFPLLAAEVGPAWPPMVPAPPAGDPERVAGWWAGLPAAARAAVVAAEPRSMGALDGLPAGVRDQANRMFLARTLADSRGEAHEIALRVAGQLAAEEVTGRHVQLLTFDPDTGLAAVALGDLDTAEAIGVLVPGVNTTVADDLPDLLLDARRVADAATAAAPGLAVATVAWLGYRTPGTLTAPLPVAAWEGGLALDSTLRGLAAARAGTDAPAPRTTVVAHSYGTVVAQEAAARPGRLAADAVVLLGSPGMSGGHSSDLEAPEVYDAWSRLDPLSQLGWFGTSPQTWAYGATELPCDWTTTHGAYYDPDRPTLAAIGEVVAGTRAPG